MKIELKPLSEQVVVITGASSGIGRATAHRLAERGARLVLFARNAEALEAVAGEVRERGGEARVVVGDVADYAQVEALAETAVREFGGLDSWVNNAGVSEYAYIAEQPVEDMRRIVDTNVLGVFHGAKAALPRLVARGGGALINVGSVLSERSIPLQGVYCATKHAVKGFTEALRMEAAQMGLPVSVTLILPAVINTPFYDNAKSRMGVRPRPVPPLYDPYVVAETIAFACGHPRRELYAGGIGRALTLMEHAAAPLADWWMVQNGTYFKNQQSDRTEDPENGRSNLFGPVGGAGSVTGSHETTISHDPVTTGLELHPNRKRALAAACLLGAAALIFQGTRRRA